MFSFALNNINNINNNNNNNNTHTHTHTHTPTHTHTHTHTHTDKHAVHNPSRQARDVAGRAMRGTAPATMRDPVHPCGPAQPAL
jgi:carbohydrate-binding DOMON domain-containing protein